MKETFYSNGKLLLTGEYLVLDGAKALALPTKFGQDLTVEQSDGSEISWTSYDSDGSIWFSDTISKAEILTLKSNPEPSVRNTLIGILHEASKLSNDTFSSNNGFEIKTHLTFPRFWGLGTSSTLINNIAQWLKVDPFVLLQNSFGGSGYDIACAQSDFPVLYQLENGNPIIQSANFNPDFSDKLYFVYLNRKQSSKAAIASYYNNRTDGIDPKIAAINAITDAVLSASNIGIFARAIERHEAIMSEILEMETVKELFFKDFTGVIKSLGGWGGDFVLIASKDDPSEYFKDRGFPVIVKYADMIK